MMIPGDLLIVNTQPPHIASVTGSNIVICEDGTLLPYNSSTMTKVFDALDVIKELERSVLQQHETR